MALRYRTVRVEALGGPAWLAIGDTIFITDGAPPLARILETLQDLRRRHP